MQTTSDTLAACRCCLKDEVRGEALDWLEDCGWGDARKVIRTDHQLMTAIERRYEGGWDEFVRNGA